LLSNFLNMQIYILMQKKKNTCPPSRTRKGTSGRKSRDRGDSKVPRIVIMWIVDSKKAGACGSHDDVLHTSSIAQVIAWNLPVPSTMARINLRFPKVRYTTVTAQLKIPSEQASEVGNRR
jgi:hypothetical protein